MYGYIVYDAYSGLIVRIAMKPDEELPQTEIRQKASHVSFYNPEICGCYLHEGNFYEDESFKVRIEDPNTYKQTLQEEIPPEITEGDPRWIDPAIVERKTAQEFANQVIKEVQNEY